MRQWRALVQVIVLSCLAALAASCAGDGEGLTESGDPDTGDEKVTIGASKDNTLYEESGSLSNGAGNHFFAGAVGAIGSNVLRRGLIAFDVAAAVPAGATIAGVTLTLRMSKSPAAGGPEAFTLHACTSDWGEGTSHAPGEEGQGGNATTGDATWVHAMFDTDNWTTAGGDFVSSESASTTVDAIGFYTWTGEQMVQDVQGWLDTPASNYGWLVMGDEGTPSSAKRFDSKENADANNRPVLEITYTQP